MPVGREREFTTFNKADVMAALDLPSERHLLLTAILTKNDYSSPVPWFGIRKNAEIVRSLEIHQYSTDFQLGGILKECIRKYLICIKKSHYKSPDHYKSRNSGGNPRYTPHTVAVVSDASPVSSDDIAAMAVSIPKPKNKTTFSKTAPKTTEPKTNSPSNFSRPKCEAKIEKDNFIKSFKTTTTTMGALTSCIHRATSLSREEARCIADRLDEAVHVFNVARIIGYKAIENFIYVKVPKRSSLLVPEETHASEFAEIDPMEHA
ncbi:MAG: hypothetical protein J3Q66DRAFT_420200 [Benniella sp.]|nr:MAG: hypothetical protein J3Q66DRAFT_420200 [Benniella sp.]